MIILVSKLNITCIGVRSINICVLELSQFKRKAYIIVMFNFDSNLRKKVLSLYMLKCVYVNNKA